MSRARFFDRPNTATLNTDGLALTGIEWMTPLLQLHDVELPEAIRCRRMTLVDLLMQRVVTSENPRFVDQLARQLDALEECLVAADVQGIRNPRATAKRKPIREPRTTTPDAPTPQPPTTRPETLTTPTHPAPQPQPEPAVPHNPDTEANTQPSRRHFEPDPDTGIFPAPPEDDTEAMDQWLEDYLAAQPEPEPVDMEAVRNQLRQTLEQDPYDRCPDFEVVAGDPLRIPYLILNPAAPLAEQQILWIYDPHRPPEENDGVVLRPKPGYPTLYMDCINPETGEVSPFIPTESLHKPAPNLLKNHSRPPGPTDPHPTAD
jgi:hypothetical protein